MSTPDDDIDPDDLTEFTFLDTEELHLVKDGANTFAPLMAKSRRIPVNDSVARARPLHGVDLRGSSAFVQRNRGDSSGYAVATRRSRDVMDRLVAAEQARIAGRDPFAPSLPAPLFADAGELGRSTLKSLRALAMLTARKRAAEQGRDAAFKDFDRAATDVIFVAAAMNTARKRAAEQGRDAAFKDFEKAASDVLSKALKKGDRDAVAIVNAHADRTRPKGAKKSAKKGMGAPVTVGPLNKGPHLRCQRCGIGRPCLCWA